MQKAESNQKREGGTEGGRESCSFDCFTSALKRPKKQNKTKKREMTREVEKGGNLGSARFVFTAPPNSSSTVQHTFSHINFQCNACPKACMKNTKGGLREQENRSEKSRKTQKTETSSRQPPREKPAPHSIVQKPKHPAPCSVPGHPSS